MANYFSAGIAAVPFLADEDMSVRWQYRLVMAASTVGSVQKFDILDTAACPRYPLGVLQNDPSAGQEASVKMIGFSKVVGQIGGCDLRQGAILIASNAGQLMAASHDKDDRTYGVWLGPTVTSGSAYGNALVNFSLAHTGSSLQLLNTTN